MITVRLPHLAKRRDHYLTLVLGPSNHPCSLVRLSFPEHGWWEADLLEAFSH